MTWADMTWPNESCWEGRGANLQGKPEAGSDLWKHTHQVLRATDCPPDILVGPCPVSPDRTGFTVTVRDFTPGDRSREALD